jgi:hypothetical protein
VEELTAPVGAPTPIALWVRDDGLASVTIASSGREGAPVSITWFKHSGPGSVAFEPAEAEVPHQGDVVRTQATFSMPGEYLLRARVNDASGVTGAGHSQCCWSNAFVRVIVGP